MGPKKPSHIKKTLSGHLPILINYHPSFLPDGRPGNITGSALWRMRTALGHRDRVHGIWFEGWDANSFDKFLSATKYHCPALESLVLRLPLDREQVIPATFLRRPDQADLPLRRFELSGGSIPSISGRLLSATALTDLTLNIPSTTMGHNPSQELVLLACLKGMQCLRSLDLTTPHLPYPHHPPPKDIALLKLTRFHLSGPTRILDKLMSKLSAPSLRDARFQLCGSSPLLHISRVIDGLREDFRSVSVNFTSYSFHLLLSMHSGTIDHFKPSFSFNVNKSPYSIKAINSSELAMAEELAFNFTDSCQWVNWEQVFSLCEFLREFRSVRVLRVDPFRFARGLLKVAFGKMMERLYCHYWKKSSYQTRSASAVQPKQWQHSSLSPLRANELVAL